MDKQQTDEIEINLLEILGVIQARWFSIVMSGLILAAIFGLGTQFLIEPQYQSTSRLYIVGQSSSITSLTDLQTGSQLTQDYMVLVQSRPVLEKVIDDLGLDMEYAELRSIVSLNNPQDSHILEITITLGDPYMAKEIVDEISDVSASRIAAIMNMDEPTIVEYGHLENTPSSPNLRRNIMLGGALGILCSALVVVVLYLLNDTIRTEEDVEKYLGLNTLALIPVEEGSMEQIIRDRQKRKAGKSIWNRFMPSKRE